MTQAIDRLNLSEPDAAQEYRALVRALRRKQGFGLFFVQASPAKGQEILTDLRRDLAGKRLAEVTIGRTEERLFEQLEAVRERENIDIFWVEGLDQSLLGYEDMQRLAGWDTQDLMTYSWKDVPPILSHLNLGRERFEARFNCAVVFVVPLFVVKYLLRRAGDFFDWKSGFFEFSDDREALAERMIEDADHQSYLKLDMTQRLEKILQIKDLLDIPEMDTERRASLLQEIGRLFHIDRNYEQAIISLDEAIHLKPNFPEAWFYKGNTFRKLGRYEESISAYQTTIKLNPKDATAYNNLGTIYSARKEYDLAIEAYQTSIGLNPKDATAYSNLGNAYYSGKQYALSLIACQKAIEINPRYANAHNNLGNTYYAQKKYGSAIISYQKSIELSPKDANPWTNLGITYKAQKNYVLAIKAYQRAIELEPVARRFAARGELYRLTQYYDEALNDFNQAVELDSNLKQAFLCRSEIYRSMSRYEEAMENFDQALKIDCEWDWAYYLRASAHLQLNKLESAETDFQKAISIANVAYGQRATNYRNTFNLALYYLAADHPEESDRLYTSNLTAPIEWLQMAIDDLNDFLQLFPDHPQAQQVKQLLQGAIQP
jgi:tetratricopeptide (TPR) repeat protein